MGKTPQATATHRPDPGVVHPLDPTWMGDLTFGQGNTWPELDIHGTPATDRPHGAAR